MEESADNILVHLGEAYRSFSSYRDVGHMEKIWDVGTERERTTRLSFSTYFKRPNLFRFEWCDHSTHPKMPDRVNVIWCDGKNSFRKNFYDDEPKSDSDLRLVVAGAAGVSSGTAHVVLALLMEEIDGHRLTDLNDLSYVGSEAVNGEECHHLHHSIRNSHIWVSQERYVLLGMADDYSIESGSSARGAGDESGLARADDGDKVQVSVSRKTTYCDLITDSEIPDTVFSLDGPPRNF